MSKSYKIFPIVKGFQRTKFNYVFTECRSVSFENLLKEKEILNAQLDRSMSLNDALQKGVDSYTKLYTMLETSSMKQIQEYTLQLG